MFLLVIYCDFVVCEVLEVDTLFMFSGWWFVNKFMFNIIYLMIRMGINYEYNSKAMNGNEEDGLFLLGRIRAGRDKCIVGCA